MTKVQTRRQWITTHEWMVKPMRQTEWISGKGLMVWLAEVFSALGMGTYLVGLIAGAWEITAWAFWATVPGWLMIVLFKFPLHLSLPRQAAALLARLPAVQQGVEDVVDGTRRGVHHRLRGLRLSADRVLGLPALGRPRRLRRPTLSVLSWITGIIAGVFMVLTGAYCGFAMSYCKGLQFWNTGLLPLVFVLMGFADGLALAMGVNLVTGADESVIGTLETWSRVFLIVNALLIAGYLLRAYQRHSAAELAAQDLIKGSQRWVFWILLVILGIVTPLVISFVTLA